MMRNYEQASTIQCLRSSFTWKLKNFSSAFFMSGFIESSKFHCSNTSWCLRIYPIHTYKVQKGIKLSLNRISDPIEQDIWYKIGFKDKDGKEVRAISKRLNTYEQPKLLNSNKKHKLLNSSEQPKCRDSFMLPGRNGPTDYAFLPLAFFRENFEDFFPDGILTVFCELRMTSVLHDNITEQIPSLGSETSTANTQSPSELAKPLDANLQVGKGGKEEDTSPSGEIHHSAEWKQMQFEMVWVFIATIIFVLAYMY